MNNVGINFFQLTFFHKMLFDVLNTYSGNTYGKMYKELNPEEVAFVWNQVRIIFDERVAVIGDEPFMGYQLIEE